jgi:hypothetical protein
MLLLMRFAVVARSLVSGLVVYVLAAACGASEKAAMVADDGGDPGQVADAFVDELGRPVREASAEEADVAEEKCDKSAGATAFAVHAYPGKSVRDLARVVALVHRAAGGDTIAGEPFPSIQMNAQIRAGAVAAQCYGPSDTVTFALPR